MHMLELGHVVLTLTDFDRSIEFYTHVLDMELVFFAEERKALRFGKQKINLQMTGAEIFPHARYPLPGSADLCFLTGVPIQQVVAHLESLGIRIHKGPVPRTGSTGPLLSVYIQDPDGNPLEIANLLNC